MTLTYLQRLEAESIHIICEVVSEAEKKPVMLYSIGKDSSRTDSSERQGRVIDHHATASMEKNKQEAYS